VEAAAVNRKSIVWFVNSEVGQLLRRNAAQIRREIPVYFTVADAQEDACDQPMIRGRLDLLLPLEDGHVIVDYKTDLVNDGSIQLRADEYRPQMELYRQAIQRITRKSVKEIYLIFLSAERVIRFA
jgi:ATP-dependent helicase/nuclease subunit A